MHTSIDNQRRLRAQRYLVAGVGVGLISYIQRAGRRQCQKITAVTMRLTSDNQCREASQGNFIAGMSVVALENIQRIVGGQRQQAASMPMLRFQHAQRTSSAESNQIAAMDKRASLGFDVNHQTQLVTHMSVRRSSNHQQ